MDPRRQQRLRNALVFVTSLATLLSSCYLISGAINNRSIKTIEAGLAACQKNSDGSRTIIWGRASIHGGYNPLSGQLPSYGQWRLIGDQEVLDLIPEGRIHQVVQLRYELLANEAYGDSQLPTVRVLDFKILDKQKPRGR